MVATFSELTRSISKEAEEGFEKTASRLREDIRNKVRQVNATFFALLVSKGIGRVSPPDLGGFTPIWGPLQDTYRLWKIRHGYSRGFFKMTGDLGDALRSRDTQKTFGSPVIQRREAGFTGKPGVTLKKGRARTETGKFARLEDVFRRVNERITVTPFPKAVDATEKEIAGLFPNFIAKKLTAWRGDTRRALVGPFLDWWIKNRITKAIDQVVR